METHHTKYKFGTADTVLLAVGTLAIDYICTSKTEILEIPPGGKRLYPTYESLELKIKQYGIKKFQYYPGSSIGNFTSQVQKIALSNKDFGHVHLATTMALRDPLAVHLLKSLDQNHIHYSITEFNANDAANPIALLVESRGYTKILSFKDKRFPAITVDMPKKGIPGMVIIGAAAGHTVQSKQNALSFAKKHNLPIGMITTEGEINELAKNAALKAIIREILTSATFLSCNEDEIRKILSAEKPGIRPPMDKIELIKQFRKVFQNENLNMLVSYGSEGSMFFFGDTVVIQKVPKLPEKEIVSTAGAGDALAGAFVEGIRMKGLDLDGVLWTMPRANRAAQNVLRYEDTRTGQFTGEQFSEEPPAEYSTEVITLT